MLGDDAEPRVLPYTFLNFPFRYTTERAVKMDQMMHPVVDVAPHPKSMYVGIFVLDKPDLQKPDTWEFYILATWAKQDADYEEGKNMVDELRQRMDDWADPYKSAVEWIPEGTNAKAVQLRIWGPPESGWDNRNGRVTLAGDAAHSMTFRKSSHTSSLRDTTPPLLTRMLQTAAKAPTTQSATVKNSSPP